MDTLEFIIPGKPKYNTVVKVAIGAIANTCGFDIETIDDIKTATLEACKTICCHGYIGLAEKYRLTCTVDKGYVQIEVRDDVGGEIKEKGVRPCQKCPQEGDLSIHIMQGLMDKVEISSGENGKRYIKIEKRLNE